MWGVDALRFYYWDDFWSIAGLLAASSIRAVTGRNRDALRYSTEADALLHSVERSLEIVRRRLKSDAVPASPYRRLDSAAVGSLTAGYPLQIWDAGNTRLHATARHLLEHHVLNDALFHDIAHSGLNPYLTLHLAQVLLRAGDPAFERLTRGAAALASPTGRWPEAVHPTLGTGCMGDGEHAWGAAEWLMMVRNCFVREEDTPPRLILCPGVLPHWLDAGAESTNLTCSDAKLNRAAMFAGRARPSERHRVLEMGMQTLVEFVTGRPGQIDFAWSSAAIRGWQA